MEPEVYTLKGCLISTVLGLLFGAVTIALFLWVFPSDQCKVQYEKRLLPDFRETSVEVCL